MVNLSCLYSLQYGKPDVPDICEVYGTVSCKADLEGTLPKVTVTLAPLPGTNGTSLNNLLTSPCVHQTSKLFLYYNMSRICPYS